MVTAAFDVTILTNGIDRFWSHSRFPIRGRRPYIPDWYGFPFHEPGKWITPAENAHQFTDDDINGVPLPGMCLLMGQYFVELLFRMRGRVDKNQWKRKARLLWEVDVYLCCLFVSCGIGMLGG